MRGLSWRCIAGHDWLYRRLNAHRRYCRRCGHCEYLAYFWSRNGVTAEQWIYEDREMRQRHDVSDERQSAPPDTQGGPK